MKSPVPRTSQAPRKVSFDNGGAFIRETRREVEAYLSSGRTRSPAPPGSTKAPIALGLRPRRGRCSCFCSPGCRRRRSASRTLAGTTLIAFCVQHDANHSAYFKHRRWNHLVGWSADALLGFSSYAWRVKHNVAHHTYTNVDGLDDDISQTPLARFSPNQAARRWYRLPAHLHLADVPDGAALADRRGPRRLPAGQHRRERPAVPSGWNLAGLLAGKAIFVVLGAGHPDARLPMVDRARGVRRVRDGDEPDHGDDVPARPLRRGGLVRVGRRGRATGRSGRCTRSRRPSTSAPATAFSPGCSAGSTSRSSTTSSRRCRTRTTRGSRRSCVATARGTACVTGAAILWVALRSHVLHLRTLGRLGVPVEIEMG